MLIIPSCFIFSFSPNLLHGIVFVKFLPIKWNCQLVILYSIRGFGTAWYLMTICVKNVVNFWMFFGTCKNHRLNVFGLIRCNKIATDCKCKLSLNAKTDTFYSSVNRSWLNIYIDYFKKSNIFIILHLIILLKMLKCCLNKIAVIT